MSDTEAVLKALKICFLVYLAVINIAAFVMYGIDKRKAEKHQWRIPEARLIMMAVCGGGAGAALGMKVFRHKTKHLKFTILVPLFTVLWIAGIAYIIITC